MENRVDSLFQEWHQLGGAVLVAEKTENNNPRSAEEIVAESTAWCRNNGRLMWVVLDWLIRNIQKVDAVKLVNETRKQGDLSVLGVLCDSASRKKNNAKFGQIIENCVPHNKLEIFFHRVSRSPLAARLTKENALDVFLNWNYLCNELRYL